jgi:outer membrane protein insertion porin family
LRTFFIQVDRTDESSFSINRLGFEPEVGFPLDRNTDLELRYSISRDDIDARNDASPAIQVDEGDRLKSSVGYRLSYDQRNDPIEPTAGYFAYLDQEVAGLGGDARFVKSRGSVKGWQGFFQGDLVFSLEVEGGAIYSFGDDTQVNDRFFLGSDSFRGFAREGIGPRDMNTDDALGGNYYAVTRLQATFPLGLPEEFGVFGGTFVDAGTLWGLDRTSFGPAGEAPGVDVDDGAKLRVSAGALLFLRTPFGPLELSVGFPIVDEEGDEDELFRLTVGTRF